MTRTLTIGRLLESFTVEGVSTRTAFRPLVSFSPRPPYDEQQGISSPLVGCGSVGMAETAFFWLLKTLFIFSVFTVPTFPSSQYLQYKTNWLINSINDLKLENISLVVGIYRGSWFQPRWNHTSLAERQTLSGSKPSGWELSLLVVFFTHTAINDSRHSSEHRLFQAAGRVLRVRGSSFLEKTCLGTPKKRAVSNKNAFHCSWKEKARTRHAVARAAGVKWRLQGEYCEFEDHLFRKDAS